MMLNTTQIAEIKKETSNENDRIPVILKVLGDPGRFRIFKLLIKHHDICVTDVATVLGVTISAASQQLRVLERVGLVRRIRMAQMVCYELRKDNPIVKQLIQFLRSSE